MTGCNDAITVDSIITSNNYGQAGQQQLNTTSENEGGTLTSTQQSKPPGGGAAGGSYRGRRQPAKRKKRGGGGLEEEDGQTATNGSRGCSNAKLQKLTTTDEESTEKDISPKGTIRDSDAGDNGTTIGLDDASYIL
jgi:hypothetical protein